jgi:hypothetical protein
MVQRRGKVYMPFAKKLLTHISNALRGTSLSTTKLSVDWPMVGFP